MGPAPAVSGISDHVEVSSAQVSMGRGDSSDECEVVRCTCLTALGTNSTAQEPSTFDLEVQ